MAILAIVVGKDIKKEQYEMLRKEVDWEHRQSEGMIFHSAGFDPSGSIHVADVWASQEAMDKFFESRLLPAMKKLKISPPNKEIYPLHAANAYDGVEQYKVRQFAH
jgi:quinol monooxygenase YgiN